MYRVQLHLVKSPDVNVFTNHPSEFYLKSSDDVCNLIKSLPKGWFITIVDFEFSSIDSIVSKLSV